MTDHDDELRTLLHDAVSDVDPPHALHDIQNRTKVTPMSSKRPWIYAAIGAVVATAATVAAVTVVSQDSPENTSGPAASPSASPVSSESSEPSEEPSAEASQTPTEEASPQPSSGTTSVPVYYVADTPTGPRLFREFHQMAAETVAASQVRAAVDEALKDSALDPDYRSGWPQGTALTGVSIDGSGPHDVVWITLTDTPGLRDLPSGMTEEQARMALQQVVYTVQAVLQQRQPVRFIIDGQPADTVLGVPTGKPLTEDSPMAVQGTVWIIDPQEGDTVTSPFTVTGRGAFFEANVSWQLLQDGNVVKSGHATAEEGMTLSPYSFEVTAPPGTYTLRVYDADMSDGEGNGEQQDTKQITVK